MVKIMASAQGVVCWSFHVERKYQEEAERILRASKKRFAVVDSQLGALDTAFFYNVDL